MQGIATMMLAHLTASESPALWAVFALGMVAGGVLVQLLPLVFRRLKAAWIKRR